MKKTTQYDDMMKMMAEFGGCFFSDTAVQKIIDKKFNQSPESNVFYSIFKGFTEIVDAMERLALIETMVRLSPPRSKRVDKGTYIKFLISAYLQEMYIFEERLNAYATKLSRLYKSPELIEQVKNTFSESLKGVRLTRGAHVHEQSYSDDALNDVSMYALFRRVNNEMGHHLETKYQLAQSEWVRRIHENNVATKQIMDHFCALIKPIICKNDKIHPPEVLSGLG